MFKKPYIIAFSVIVIIIVSSFVFFDTATAPINPSELPLRNPTLPEVPTMAVYPTKIIYTTDVTTPKDLYQGDCSMRGGVFNNCGNGCAPEAEVCAMLCAFTCTFDDNTK